MFCYKFTVKTLGTQRSTFNANILEFMKSRYAMKCKLEIIEHEARVNCLCKLLDKLTFLGFEGVLMSLSTCEKHARDFIPGIACSRSALLQLILEWE